MSDREVEEVMDDAPANVTLAGGSLPSSISSVGTPVIEPQIGETGDVTAQLTPGDSEFSRQWHLLNTSNPATDMNVTTVWDDYQGRGVKVGVVDEGIDPNHPDLVGSLRSDLDWDGVNNDSLIPLQLLLNSSPLLWLSQAMQGLVIV